jgi:hypothetical protein
MELARQLCPVRAPDSLWRAIHEQRRPLRVQPHPWKAWSIAAAVLTMLLAGLVWRLGATRETSGDMEALAERELRGLANGSRAVDLRSGDAGEIERWVKTRVGVDIRLADRPVAGGGAVRLIGVRIIQYERNPVAVIAYQVGDDFGAMLVADGRARAGFAGIGGSGSGHAASRMRSSGDVLLYSWRRGVNDYAIAFGGGRQSERACLLCHADRPALMVFR